ncbi:MAG: NYN domain-containing protein [Myxococcota bacterium]
MANTNRIALFLNGKTFYASWRDSAKHRHIDFPAMTRWIVDKAGGDTLTGAHYFTGIDEDREQNQESGSHKLRGFLEMLVRQPGFFTHRVPRRTGVATCEHCGGEHTFISDKEADLALAVEAMHLASGNTFDTAVLVTGDGDYEPLARRLRAMGKRVHIAAWGSAGVSKRLRAAAFSFIDLLAGVNAFSQEDSAVSDEILPFTGEHRLDTFLSEIVAASNKFQGGFVGVEYFLNNWRSPHLDDSEDHRRGVLNELLMENWVETHEADNGDLAVRLSERGIERLQELNDGAES